MQVGFLITSGGPHPADKWAEITANQIVDTLLVDANADSNTPEALKARAAKRKLRNELFDLFEGHHDGVQKHERAANAMVKKIDIAMARSDHTKVPLDPSTHVDTIMDSVKELFSATPWADHLAKAEVVDVVKSIISQHTADVMHIERRWHKDRLAAKGA